MSAARAQECDEPSASDAIAGIPTTRTGAKAKLSDRRGSLFPPTSTGRIEKGKGGEGEGVEGLGWGVLVCRYMCMLEHEQVCA